MASIGWIDFSKDHRNRVGAVLDLLKTEGMVDELGLGTLRDGLANKLFPGISTVQTRARYFFIIPYILYDYQQLKPAQRRGKSASKFLEQQEYEVMWELAARYNYEERNGVIGITKRRPHKIARRPSAIYWNGLSMYQFIDTRGLAAEAYLKQVTNPSIESLLADAPSGDDNPRDDHDAEFENEFRIKIPIKENWQKDLYLDLERDEAELFADRISSKAKNLLIAELLNNNKLWEIFTASRDFMDFVNAAGELRLRDDLYNTLVLAHDFSQLMYGVHLAYNCQLQKKIFSNTHWDKEWKAWVDELSTSMLNYEGFNPQEVFQYSFSTRETTKTFVTNWWNLVQHNCNDLKVRDTLILRQEALVKGSKARLQWGKTEDVKADEWIGLRTFDYRFNQARTIINDIRAGLKR
ncbi:DUF6361 family protein [Chryseolinea sp. T2]|uniref:DUF6361 family protein n=1 Tax=Chryseolinea sp. T2 TaxID=3129255 RepID=UPI0030776DE4